MQIAVYGATGMVGSEITAEALRRGHQVTAVSRSGTALEGTAARTADLGDAAEFARIAGDHDLVVVSVAPDRAGNTHESYLKAHRSIAASKAPARIFVIGGAGALEIDGVQLKDTPGFPLDYKAEAETMTKVLDAYREAEDLDWTMLAPAPQITPGERTGSYTLGTDSPAGHRISTQDFAVAALDEIESARHRKQRFTAAN